MRPNATRLLLPSFGQQPRRITTINQIQPAKQRPNKFTSPRIWHDTHRCQRETLGAIGKRYGVTYQSLAELNGLQSPFTIFAGQSLLIRKTTNGAPTTQPAPKTHETQTYIGSTAANHPVFAIANKARAPWLAYAEHERKLGIRRGGGQVSNQHIQEYATATTMGRTNDASYAYCAAFANWCLTNAGFAGTRSARAIRCACSSELGKSTKQNRPAYGALALIKFPEVWCAGGHHVTFVIGKSERQSHCYARRQPRRQSCRFPEHSSCGLGSSLPPALHLPRYQ